MDQIIHEAARLVGWIRPGERLSKNYFDSTAIHYKSLQGEFPQLSPSLMAHELAGRLQLKVDDGAEELTLP